MRAIRVALRETRELSLTQALAQAHGCIKDAADLLGIHRSHCARLLKLFGLGEYAMELRLEHGRPATGRPKRRAPERQQSPKRDT